jgi:pimeloyl-ACP methyl ester carboxylesterase
VTETGTCSAVREAEIGLRDGRRLTYLAAGDERGFPVLYLHGAIGSPRWRTPGLDSLIERLGIRYVVVNRPGFGGSDPSPGRTVAGFATDVEDLADGLGFERFSVVGLSAGAPYALACA